MLHVHDEIVCEVSEDFGSEEEFLRIMLELPDWAAGLPIAGKVRSGKRYAKSSAKRVAEGTTETEPLQLQVGISGVPEPGATDQRTSGLPDGSESDHNLADAENDDDDDETEVLLADLIDDELGDDKMMCCPFHADSTPSMKIYHDHYHCFGCGAHGGRIDWLMAVEGHSRAEATHLIKNWDGPITQRQSSVGDDALKRASALHLWEEAHPIAGTLAARYLADTRGVDLAALPAAIDDVLRFHPRCPFGHGTCHPCLLALMRNTTTDAPTGIHRIALTPKILAGGRPVERRLLGQTGAVKLWPAGAQLVIGEGIETVLAAATRIPYRDTPLRPAWSMISAGPLGNFPVLPGVERLIALVDHDLAGKNAAFTCTERWTRAGRTVVRLMHPRPGADFNDFVMPEPIP